MSSHEFDDSIISDDVLESYYDVESADELEGVDELECADELEGGDQLVEGEKVRYYDNEYDDYEMDGVPNVKFIKDGKMQRNFLLRIQATANTYLGSLIAQIAEESTCDYTVYTGITGWALLFFMLGCAKNNTLYLQKALTLSQRAQTKLKCKRPSFLSGDSGALAVCAVLMYRHGLKKEAHSNIVRIYTMLPQALLLSHPGVPDDVLLGRAGYLYTMLFLRVHLGDDMVDTDKIREVSAVLLRSCVDVATSLNFPAPLMSSWLEKPYLGASRGLTGVLYVLLLARDFLRHTDLELLVRPSIDYLQEKCNIFENLPTSIAHSSNDLVQWCHGVSGVIHLFCLARTVFGDESYLTTAVECGEVVWKRGLLRKGYSLCHGVAGNGYAFLQLYQATNHPKHLHRACVFADWCTEYGKNAEQEPDHPLSLFDGIAGVIFFLNEIQDPMTARYPGFNLPLPRVARYNTILTVHEN